MAASNILIYTVSMLWLSFALLIINFFFSVFIYFNVSKLRDGFNFKNKDKIYEKYFSEAKDSFDAWWFTCFIAIVMSPMLFLIARESPGKNDMPGYIGVIALSLSGMSLLIYGFFKFKKDTKLENLQTRKQLRMDTINILENGQTIRFDGFSRFPEQRLKTNTKVELSAKQKSIELVQQKKTAEIQISDIVSVQKINEFGSRSFQEENSFYILKIKTSLDKKSYVVLLRKGALNKKLFDQAVVFFEYFDL